MPATSEREPTCGPGQGGDVDDGGGARGLLGVHERVRGETAFTSVLLTSMVFPLDAVRMSPGRRPRLPIMFSQLATMKCASTPGGAVSAMMRAAPSVAPAPPMSNFIISSWTRRPP